MKVRPKLTEDDGSNAVYGLSDDHPFFSKGVRVIDARSEKSESTCLLALSLGRYGAFLGMYGTKSKHFKLGTKRSRVRRIIDVQSIDKVQRATSAVNESQVTSSSGGIECVLESQGELLEADKSFQIFCENKRLDLQASSHEEREELVDTLNRVVLAYKKAGASTPDAAMMRRVWPHVNSGTTDSIDAQDLSDVLHMINVKMKGVELSQNLSRVSKGTIVNRGSSKINFDQCVDFLRELKKDPRYNKHSRKIWNEVFGKHRKTVSAELFLSNFLHKVQGDTELSIEYVKVVFALLYQMDGTHELPDPKLDPLLNIDLYRFQLFLTSSKNDAFDPSKESFIKKQLFSKPLSHYFINSSHNTYLTGDQVKSKSSVEMYMSALMRGYKCLEIDVWDPKDSSEAREPVVYHGRTLTPKILLRSVLEVIDEFLEYNPKILPIILSIENHCSIPFQELMADIFLSVLGKKLYIPDGSAFSGNLPSPDSLRGKVVLKGKGRCPAPEEPSDETKSDSSCSTTVKPFNHRISNISPKFSKLILLHGTKFKSFRESKHHPNFAMHSFKESLINDILSRNEGEKFMNYNKKHLSRVYPSGTRIMSTNYSPVLAWSMGCQLVSLNFQTKDHCICLNDAFFRQSGNCGYVLKPPDIRARYTFGRSKPVKATIAVLGASNLPKPKGNYHKRDCVDPYVKVTVFDVDLENRKEITRSFLTAEVKNNGFCPSWGDEFNFKVHSASIAMLLFTVMDASLGKDPFLARAAIPLSCIRSGYRSVQLLDSENTSEGAFKFASLLIRVKMSDPSETTGGLNAPAVSEGSDLTGSDVENKSSGSWDAHELSAINFVKEPDVTANDEEIENAVKKLREAYLNTPIASQETDLVGGDVDVEMEPFTKPSALTDVFKDDDSASYRSLNNYSQHSDGSGAILVDKS